MGRLPEQHDRQEEEAAPVAVAAVPVPAGLDPAGPLDAGSVLALQRTAGNAKVASALMHPATGAPAPAASPGGASRAGPLSASGALARCVEERSREQAPAGQPSPAQLLRSRLRSNASLRRSVLHRAIKTSGGEWDTETYDLKIDDDGSGPAPAAQGWRGMDIKLKLTPDPAVDAELIGITQTSQTVIKNAPAFAPGGAARSIGAGDAEPVAGRAGETDEGTKIDQLAGYNNPMYAVAAANSASLDDPVTGASWGQHGWRYTDKARKVKQQDAKLIDAPRAPGAQKDSRQVFEATALATKGAQAGTYYGSVRWGWQTDSAGVHSKIPLSKVSDGVPSSTFLKSAQLWNAAKTTSGGDTIDLPVPDVKVTTAAVVLMPGVPLMNITLPAGTRLQVIHEPTPPRLTGTVKVVDGPHTGVTGDVDFTEWSLIGDERA